MTWTIHTGEAMEVLATMPDESVQCCVTSPPYWGLRDYGHDGQIGLEQTPEAYTARLVEVFRDVRRVLRDDGTVWLNLGDSYASDTKGSGGPPGATLGRSMDGAPRTGRRERYLSSFSHGLKPKDLVGIPWLVAKALQAPQYNGRIKNEHDRIWLAAMIDAEGCIFIHKRKAGQHNGQGYHRKNDNFGAGLEVANTCRSIVDRCMEIAGVGSICSQSPDKNPRRKQTIYRWNVRSKECLWVLHEVYPYLVAKQQEARIALGCPSSGGDAAKSHESLIAIHNGNDPTIDFKAPESLYSPGWYLRSDIIWNKCNPMPESVTDRPTKGHEYVFLLSKSARYFYDADAVKEESIIGEGAVRNVACRNKGNDGNRQDGDRFGVVNDGTRNRRTVWTIPTQPYPGAHFAVMPPALVEPCILAGCPEGGTVLDPFAGAGTVGLVASRLQRSFVGVELNEEYAEMARQRIHGDAPLFGGDV